MGVKRPIVLHTPRLSQTSDDSGTFIVKSVLPRSAVPNGQYAAPMLPLKLGFVPSLAAMCIVHLAPYADQVATALEGHPRLTLRDPDEGSPTIVDEVIACTSASTTEDPRAAVNQRKGKASSFHIHDADPRLYLLLVSLYPHGLPSAFSIYRTALSDKYLPLLQHPPTTPSPQLLTILSLPNCDALSDDSIHALKPLIGLMALDASNTGISAHGVRVLARTLTRSGDQMNGPWGLRVLRLWGCRKVNDDVYSLLGSFPLLCAIDLGRTRCTFKACPFETAPSSMRELYHPAPISLVADVLEETYPGGAFKVLVDRLHHPSRPHSDSSQTVFDKLWKGKQAKADVSSQDTFVVFPTSRSSGGQGGHLPVKVGNLETLARSIERREEEDRHERNKIAWYERNGDLCDISRYMLHQVRNDHDAWPTLAPAHTRRRTVTAANFAHSVRDMYNAQAPSLPIMSAPRPTNMPHRLPDVTRSLSSACDPVRSRAVDTDRCSWSESSDDACFVPLPPRAPRITSFYEETKPMRVHEPCMVFERNAGDAALMLFREPPPVNAITTACVEEQKVLAPSKLDTPATLAKQSHRARQGIRALEQLRQNCASTSSAQPKNAAPTAVTPLPSRNPFLKKIEPTVPAPSAAKIAISTNEHESAPCDARPLKRISTLAVPELTSEQSVQHRKRSSESAKAASSKRVQRDLLPSNSGHDGRPPKEARQATLTTMFGKRVDALRIVGTSKFAQC